MNPKMIATIGKRTEEYDVLKALVLAGVDIVRLNFSHANAEQFLRVKERLSQIAKETGKCTKIMADLQGPRIRVGIFEGEIQMIDGEEYELMSQGADISKKQIPIDNEELVGDVRPGEIFYLANGLIEMKVLKTEGQVIFARVERGGVLLQRKGINLPQTILKSGGLTSKDIEDARFCAEHGVDYISLSFVQGKEDIEKLRKELGDFKGHFFAKIERATALRNIDDIIKSSDGIMVARGDLGIEIPLEEVPIVQKDLIRHAHWHSKPAIVATEMMASMINHSRPTRAEVADIANAVFDGADAVMLSDETAAGNYPLEAARTMKKIIKRVDDHFNNTNYLDVSCKRF